MEEWRKGSIVGNEEAIDEKKKKCIGRVFVLTIKILKINISKF